MKEGAVPMEQTKKMLIVDDVELNRAILCEIFYQKFEVLEAENGKEALDIIEEQKDSIAVILLDIVMPVMDGLEVLEILDRKNLLKEIPVLLITAEIAENITLRGYKLGVTDVISKPFNPNIVKLRVGNIVELYEYRKNLENVVRRQTATLENQAVKLRQSNSFFIETLNTVVEFRDCESGQHIRRIRDITRLFLEAMGKKSMDYFFTPEQIDIICDAAAMHDIGKIAISDSILNKPGKLTKDEFEIMKTHTVKGCEILTKLDSMQDEEHFDYCYDICRHHHERWDGGGYPDGLRGNEISIWAQIISLADVYDALVNERVYKAAYTHEQAVAMILNGECGVFSPELLSCFVDLSELLLLTYQNQNEDEHKDNKNPKRKLYPLREYRTEDNTSERLLRLMQKEREKYQIIAETSGEIIFDYDSNQDELVFSEPFQLVFGKEIQFTNVIKTLKNCNIIMEEDKKFLMEIERFAPFAQPVIRKRMRLKTVQGSWEWFEAYIRTVWDESEPPACIGALGKLSNINDLKAESALWQEKALRDALTGLYNRGAFKELAGEYLKTFPEHYSAIFFIDLDNFKEINDTLGHLAGDQFLIYISRRIYNCFRGMDIVGRIGGDEFVVFMKDVKEKDLIDKKAQMLCKVFEDNFNYEDTQIEVSASIGIARYPIDSNTYEDLLNKADKALYHAKNSGKGQFLVYNDMILEEEYQSLLSEIEDTDEKEVKEED